MQPLLPSHSLYLPTGYKQNNTEQVTFLFNELLWCYTSGDCVMHSTVRFVLWWRTTCTSPPSSHKQIWTRWNVIQQFTLFNEQSVEQLRLKSDSVWSSLSLRYHHRWLLIGQRRLSLRKCKFHILGSLMACPTALPKFSEPTTDNTLPNSLRTSESYDVWPLLKISMAGMVACNLYFLNSLFRQHIFSLSNVYRTKA